EGLGRGRAEADDDPRLHERDLGLKPPVARVDLHGVRLRVDPSLAARLPLEVLHDVRDVDLVTRDLGFLECPIEHAPRRPDERVAELVLLITGLLSDEEQRSSDRSLAEDRLRGTLVQVTRVARARGEREIVEVGVRWDEREGW